MTILEFQERYSSELLKMLPQPKWQPNLSNFNKEIVEIIANKKGRKPFASQLEYVIAPLLHLFLEEKKKYGVINAEMGTGKTTMSNIIAYTLFKKEYEPKGKGMKIMFLASGAKHIQKMKREAEAVFADLAEVYIIRTKPRKSKKYHEVTIEEAAKMQPQPGKILYFVLSKDTGKGGMKIKGFSTKGIKPSERKKELLTEISDWDIKQKMKKIVTKQVCPDCGAGFPDIKFKEIYECPHCGSKLFTGHSGKPSFADRLERLAKYKTDKFWDFLIVDEVHEFQNPNSLQSILFKAVLKRSYRTLIMTGTLSNGYASSIFHILYPMFHEEFKKYGFSYDKIGAFVDYYGSKKEESITTKVMNKARKTVKVEELPRINDKIVGFLAPYTVWFSLEDLNIEMPPLKEEIHIVEVNQEVKERFEDFRTRIIESSDSLELTPKNQIRPALASFSYKLNNPTFPYEQSLKGYPIMRDNNGVLTFGKEIIELKVPFEPLPEEEIFNKEKKLVELVQKELAEGRRVMIYGVYNHATGLYQRLLNVLNMHGIDAGVLPDKIKAEDIEEWIINFDKDVLILPQKRVATGLDLVMFHTVIFYEIDKQLRVVSQAKARPWRPVGQEKEVRIHYIAYKGQQERELRIMAEKMRSAATVEGKIIDSDTIAAIYDYNPEITEAIANIAQTIQQDSASVLRRPLSDFEQYYEEKLAEKEEEEKDSPSNNNTPEEGEDYIEKIEEESKEKISQLQEQVARNIDSPLEIFSALKNIASGKKQDSTDSIEKVIQSAKEIENTSIKEEPVYDIQVDEKGQMYFVF